MMPTLSRSKDSLSKNRSAELRGLPMALLLLSLIFLLPTVAGAQPSPVIIAVDTSRSLNASALGETVDRLRLTLEALDKQTPTALLAFDDEPRWLARPGATPKEVAGKLQELQLQGNYTLLNDALFVATRELRDGGVLLLVTDGRDENSAVVVDDIARRCEAQDVRILSLGSGTNVEEKALRRLALISNGAYLGPINDVDAGDVVSGVKKAQKEVSEAAAAATPVARPASPSAATGAQPGQAAAQGPAAGGPATAAAQPNAGGVPGPADGRPGADEGAWWQNPAVWGLVTLVVLLLVALARRRRPGSSEEIDDSDMEAAEAQASDEAEAGLIRLELAQAEIAVEEEAPEVTVDTAVFQRMTLDERLDRTRVLSNHSVLVMKKLGERPRTFMLDRQKAFGVGRDSHKNTLPVPDPALSSQHFKIVPRDDTYYFVDLESTNGSYINGRRVGAKRLRHSDTIRAGQVEFEYQNYSNV